MTPLFEQFTHALALSDDGYRRVQCLCWDDASVDWDRHLTTELTFSLCATDVSQG